MANVKVLLAEKNTHPHPHTHSHTPTHPHTPTYPHTPTHTEQKLQLCPDLSMQGIKMMIGVIMYSKQIHTSIYLRTLAVDTEVCVEGPLLVRTLDIDYLPAQGRIPTFLCYFFSEAFRICVYLFAYTPHHPTI